MFSLERAIHVTINSVDPRPAGACSTSRQITLFLPARWHHPERLAVVCNRLNVSGTLRCRSSSCKRGPFIWCSIRNSPYGPIARLTHSQVSSVMFTMCQISAEDKRNAYNMDVDKGEEYRKEQ